jgi:hypothetical protein
MRIGPHLAAALGVIALAGATLGMGATPTDWFNVFGDNFDPSVPATLTFSAPVIPWSVEQPMSVQAPVTSYTMPAKYMAGGFKWTFRAQDGKIQEVAVRITGKGCEARTVVDLSPPGTSTVPGAPASRDQSPASLLILLVSIGGAIAMLWRLHSERNRLSPPFPPEPTS